MGAGVGEKQSRNYTTTMAPSRKSLQLYDSLTKAESTVLVQFRTGKIGFQAYLAAIGVSDSALCNCGRSPQTIKHVLNALRIRTWTGDGAGIPRTLNAFLTDPKRVAIRAKHRADTLLGERRGGGRSGIEKLNARWDGAVGRHATVGLSSTRLAFTLLIHYPTVKAKARQEP
jgi:hypothetical protein